MPVLAFLHILIAIGFIVHATRTGRPQWWITVLLMIPLFGSIAYVLFEILPELAQTRRTRRVVNDLRTIADPDRTWRERLQGAKTVDSIQSKTALAEECERRNMWGEAIRLYRAAAVGQFADDPHLLLRIARAEFGAGLAADAQGTLDHLQRTNPSFESQEAHMLYARALEAQNELDEAAASYEALIRYFVGFEARARYALLLQRMGQPEKARALFEEIARSGDARRRTLIEVDKNWLKVAKRNLEV